MSENEHLLTLVLETVKQIQKSPALNGGFDRLVVAVDNIKDRLDTNTGVITKIHDGLYDPKGGLYSQVKTVETNQVTDQQNFDDLQDEVEKLSAHEAKHDTTVEVTDKLKKLAGEDLAELAATLKIRKTLDKIFWMVVVGTIGAFSKGIWEFIKAK